MKITKKQLEDALNAMSMSDVSYPLAEGETAPVTAPLIEWFILDVQDAMDFGVLKEPKFDGYSDIRIMQYEWYVEEILREPFKNALKSLGIEVT